MRAWRCSDDEEHFKDVDADDEAAPAPARAPAGSDDDADDEGEHLAGPVIDVMSKKAQLAGRRASNAAASTSQPAKAAGGGANGIAVAAELPSKWPREGYYDVDKR